MSPTGTPAPLSMRPAQDLADVVALMLDSGVRSVPVVDDGELLGFVVRQRRGRSVPGAAVEGIQPEGAWT